MIQQRCLGASERGSGGLTFTSTSSFPLSVLYTASRGHIILKFEKRISCRAAKRGLKTPKEMTPEVLACVCLWLREVRAGALQASLDEPVLEHTLQASH